MSDAPDARVSGALQSDDHGDGADETSLTSAIGSAISAARRTAGISMRELARRAGVSQPFLSQVERGASVPSLLTLYRIAGALGVSPSMFMPAIGGRRDVVVVRRGEGTRLPVTDGPRAAAGRLLAAGPAHRLEVVEYSIHPDDDLGDWFQSEGELTVYVISGRLVVEVEDEGEWPLDTGDAITHDAERRHRWRAGPDGATVLLAIAHEGNASMPGRRNA